MTLRAGSMNRRVQWQRRAAGKDGMGQLTESWTPVQEIWAEIVPLGGRELESAKAVHAESSHQVTCRYRAGLTEKDRLVYEGRIYNILNKNDVEMRHEVLVLLCSEGVALG